MPHLSLILEVFRIKAFRKFLQALLPMVEGIAVPISQELVTIPRTLIDLGILEAGPLTNQDIKVQIHSLIMEEEDPHLHIKRGLVIHQEGEEGVIIIRINLEAVVIIDQYDPMDNTIMERIEIHDTIILIIISKIVK
jgi:hypothetical protein